MTAILVTLVTLRLAKRRPSVRSYTAAMIRRSQHRSVRRVLLLAIAVVSLLTTACSDSSSSSQTTIAEPDPTVEPQLVSDSGAVPLHACVDGATLVACSSPHDAQNYAVFDSSAATYDSDALLKECYPYFLEFTGTPIGESGLSGETWYPDQADWDQGTREVRCLVLFEVPATASLPELDLAAGFAGRMPWSSIDSDSCVNELWDIDLVSVQTTSCTGNERIDILGLVDVEDATAQCQGLAVLADAPDQGQVESSWLLEARGYTKSICYRELGDAP